MAEITLRAIEEHDLPLIQSWRNSNYVMPNCRQYRPLSYEDMLRWYKTQRDDDYNLSQDLFIIVCDNKDIGVGGFTRIDWRNRKGEVSFYIGDISSMAEETVKLALSHIIQYGLATLCLRKIYFPCYEFNPYLPYYKEVMNEEYIAKSEYYQDGKFWDRIILSKFAEDK